MHARRDLLGAVELGHLIGGGIGRIEGRGEFVENLPHLEDGRRIVADLALGEQGDDGKSARHRDRVAHRPHRHLRDDTGDGGLELVELHPSEIAPLQRGLALAELGGDQGEGCSLAQLADHRFSEVTRILDMGAVLGRDEDLGDVILHLPSLGLDRGEPRIDVGVADAVGRSDLGAEHAAPAELHADLVIEGADLRTPRGEPLGERPGRHVVALLQIDHRLGDILVGDGDLAPLHLLELEFLVDQLAHHLRGEAVEHLRRHRKPGGEGKEPAAVIDVLRGDRLAIDHGEDA